MNLFTLNPEGIPQRRNGSGEFVRMSCFDRDQRALDLDRVLRESGWDGLGDGNVGVFRPSEALGVDPFIFV